MLFCLPNNHLSRVWILTSSKILYNSVSYVFNHHYFWMLKTEPMAWCMLSYWQKLSNPSPLLEIIIINNGLEGL